MLKLDPDVEISDTEFLSIMKRIGFRQNTGGKNFEGIQPRFVFRLDVEGKTAEEVMEGFASKTRYNIRLAERKGVEVKVCGKEMLDVFQKSCFKRESETAS